MGEVPLRLSDRTAKRADVAELVFLRAALRIATDFSRGASDGVPMKASVRVSLSLLPVDTALPPCTPTALCFGTPSLPPLENGASAFWGRNKCRDAGGATLRLR